jgi:protein-S-isoprenylcysteine O-methyltransferase Ste14
MFGIYKTYEMYYSLDDTTITEPGFLCGGTMLLLPGLICRMGVEENLLVDEFGDAYRTTIQKTRRLFPGLW